MSRSRSPRAAKVAVQLLMGKSKTEAARAAGYDSQTSPWAIVSSKAVQEELQRLGAAVMPQDLSDMAKGRILKLMVDGVLEPKDIVSVSRLVWELNGEIGKVQEHRHQHELTLSEETRMLLAPHIAKHLAASTVDAEVISHADSGPIAQSNDSHGDAQVQARSASLGLQQGPAGQEKVASDCDSPIRSSESEGAREAKSEEVI